MAEPSRTIGPHDLAVDVVSIVFHFADGTKSEHYLPTQITHHVKQTAFTWSLSFDKPVEILGYDVYIGSNFEHWENHATFSSLDLLEIEARFGL